MALILLGGNKTTYFQLSSALVSFTNASMERRPGFTTVYDLFSCSGNRSRIVGKWNIGHRTIILFTSWSSLFIFFHHVESVVSQKCQGGLCLGVIIIYGLLCGTACGVAYLTFTNSSELDLNKEGRQALC